MMRAVCFLLLLTLVTATIGCQQDIEPGADLENATTVTIDQFRDATQDDDSFRWIGSDNDFHYFRTRKGFFRVATSEVEMPSFQSSIDRGQAEPGSVSSPAYLHPERNVIVAGLKGRDL